MDFVLDTLRLFNYQQFINKHNLPLISKTYFLNQNQNEQFYYLSVITAWLIQKNKHQFDIPDRFDDPNATIAKIIDALKSLGIQFDHGPNKLRQGYGEAVIQMLSSLCERALKDYKFKKPSHNQQDYSDEAQVDDEAEVTLEKAEEQFQQQQDDDDDQVLFPVFSSSKNIQIEHRNSSAKLLDIIHSSSTPEQHRLELERVTPQLQAKINIVNDNKDWRIHWQQLMHYHSQLTKFDNADSNFTLKLSNLLKEIEQSLEKISSREKYLNSQFEPQLEEIRVLQEHLSTLKQKQQAYHQNFTGQGIELSRVSEQLDKIKSQMDQIGSGMTDSKPLVQIKQGYSKLKNEMKQMDLRIGVIQHILMEANIHNKDALMHVF